MKKYFAAAALLLGLAACGSRHNLPLEGTTWKLTSMDGIPAAAMETNPDAFTLEFNAADTMVFGATNCNRFFGKYDVKGDKIGFANMGMTRMACPDMQYEDAFVKMLGEVTRYAVNGEELTLFDEGTNLATFKALVKGVGEK